MASNDTDNERDEADVDEDADDDDDDEQRRVQNYEEYVKEHETASDLKDVPAEEFEKYVSQCDDDEGFQKFSKRVKNEPEQVRNTFDSLSEICSIKVGNNFAVGGSVLSFRCPTMDNQ